MSDTIDPIVLLREQLLQKRQIEYVPESKEIYFKELGVKVPRDLRTAFKRSDKPEQYSIGQLWFLLSNADLKFTDYLNRAKGEF